MTATRKYAKLKSSHKSGYFLVALGAKGAFVMPFTLSSILEDILVVNTFIEYFLVVILMVDRIKMLCRAKNTSVTKLEVALGFGNGTIGKWKTAKSDPPIDKLQKIADYLGVSVGYLLTGENKKPTQEGELTDAQREAMELVMQMSDDQLRVFIATLKAVVKE